MGGTFLTNQLVGWSAFQGRKESLTASPLRKTDNRIGKEGEGREGGWERETELKSSLKQKLCTEKIKDHKGNLI